MRRVWSMKNAITRIRAFLQLTVFAKKALLPTRSEFEKEYLQVCELGAAIQVCEDLEQCSCNLRFLQKKPSYQHAQRRVCQVYDLEQRFYVRAIRRVPATYGFCKKGPLTNTLRIRKGATLNICQVCGLGAAILRAACLVYVKLTVFAKKALRIRREYH